MELCCRLFIFCCVALSAVAWHSNLWQSSGTASKACGPLKGPRAGLLLTTRHHWGGGGVPTPPTPLDPSPPPLKRLGQIFFRTFGQPIRFSGAFGAN